MVYHNLIWTHFTFIEISVLQSFQKSGTKKSSWINLSRKQTLPIASPFKGRQVALLLLPTPPESAKLTLLFYCYNICRAVNIRNRQAINVFYIISLIQFLNWNCARKACITWLLLILYSVTLSKRDIVNHVDIFRKKKKIKNPSNNCGWKHSPLGTVIWWGFIHQPLTEISVEIWHKTYKSPFVAG